MMYYVFLLFLLGWNAEAKNICLGKSHTCAIFSVPSGNNVKCWGVGSSGQLGYGNYSSVGENRSVSNYVDYFVNMSPQNDRSAIQLSCGEYHTCALLDDGTVRCWGNSLYGILGQADTGIMIGIVGIEPADASVINISSNQKVISICSGSSHNCALLSNGRVRCWGRNYNGQLGYGMTQNIGDDEKPSEAGDVNVSVDSSVLVKGISCGFEHTCVLLVNGKVKCWGKGNYGVLGYGNEESIGIENVPASVGYVEVASPNQAVIQIEAGAFTTCVLLDTFRVKCWGRDFYGRLGTTIPGNVGDVDTPLHSPYVNITDEENVTVVSLSSSHSSTCALLSNQNVRCWGFGFYGSLGYGNTENVGENITPNEAGDVNVSAPVALVETGYSHTCIVTTNGSIQCWGKGRHGVLGYGNEDTVGTTNVPADVGFANVDPIPVSTVIFDATFSPTPSPTLYTAPTDSPTSSPLAAPPTPLTVTTESIAVEESGDGTEGEGDNSQSLTVLILVVALSVVILCAASGLSAAYAYRAKYKEKKVAKPVSDMDIFITRNDVHSSSSNPLTAHRPRSPRESMGGGGNYDKIELKTSSSFLDRGNGSGGVGSLYDSVSTLPMSNQDYDTVPPPSLPPTLKPPNRPQYDNVQNRFQLSYAPVGGGASITTTPAFSQAVEKKGKKKKKKKKKNVLDSSSSSESSSENQYVEIRLMDTATELPPIVGFYGSTAESQYESVNAKGLQPLVYESVGDSLA